MSQPSGETSPHRRATWVALRTLRQRPAVVGRTEGGETVYEVRSVRLVLRGDAPYFNRLVACSKCAGDLPGTPVLTAADLDHPSHPVICAHCVRSAPARPQPAAQPRPEPAEADLLVDEPISDEPTVNGRLSEVEAQLRAVTTQLGALADVGPALADVRSEVRELAEGATRRVTAIETEFRRSVGAFQAIVESQRSQIAALTGAVDGARSDIERVAESHRELARMHSELDQRRLDTTHAEMASLETRLQEHVTGLTQLVEAQRGSLAGVVHRELQVLAQAEQGRAEAGDDLADRLRTLERNALDGEERVRALTASTEAGADAVHALERKVQASLKRLTRLLATQGGAWPAPSPVRRPEMEGGNAGGLLEDLDRQLREAADRLAQR